jgi:predicted PurR-regulated permease PerM
MPTSGEGPSVRSVLRVVAVVVCSVITLYLIYLLRKPLSWIVIGAFIAVALAAPVTLVERRVRRRGIAIAIVYLGLILIPILIAAILIPPLVTETNNLIDKVPEYVKDIQKFVRENHQLHTLEEHYNITAKLQEEAAKLPGKLGGAAGVLSDIGLGLVNSLFALITILILSIFMIGSGPRWVDAAIRSRPRQHQELLRRAAGDISNAVGGYVAGALGQATVAGVTSFVVLTILGVPYAAALALIIALLDLVPLVGATLGAVLVGIVTVFNDFPTDTIIWVVWSIVYQQIENTVIQPRIQSRAVDVQPFIVLIAVLFGSTLFGILGALLAIPAAATLQIAYREFRNYRRMVRMEAIETGDMAAEAASPDHTPSPVIQPGRPSAG